MAYSTHSSDLPKQFDPTGQVDLEDAAAVERAVCTILDRQYAGNYDLALLRSSIADLVRAYQGEYPGLLRCDGLYHDLRHALEAGLTMARLLDGYAITHPPDSAAGIDAPHALFGILLAFFHDIGMIRRNNEEHLWGPELTPVHEERGVEFVQAYLTDTTLSSLLDESKLIMATKLIYKMPADWSDAERMLASLVATADLVSQISDRYYLEKCRDFLFLEFCAFGMAGSPDSTYPDRQTLLEKTPEFVEGFVQNRMDKEFQGVHRYLQVHMGGADPWQEITQRNMGYLKTLLEKQDLGRLLRHPKSYTGTPPLET